MTFNYFPKDVTPGSECMFPRQMHFTCLQQKDGECLQSSCERYFIKNCTSLLLKLVMKIENSSVNKIPWWNGTKWLHCELICHQRGSKKHWQPRSFKQTPGLSQVPKHGPPEPRGHISSGISKNECTTQEAWEHINVVSYCLGSESFEILQFLLYCSFQKI